MSPILIRPVREQLEHDRIIRILQARLRRRFEVAINIGPEQTALVRIGRVAFYPDLVLTSTGRGHKLAGIVEVETGESVNHLEAMAQWVQFARARVPFSLYVPSGSADIARRLCADKQVTAVDVWTYHTIGSQVRFMLVHRAPAPTTGRTASRRGRSTPASGRKPAGRTGTKPAKRGTARPVRRQKRK